MHKLTSLQVQSRTAHISDENNAKQTKTLLKELNLHAT